MNRLLRQRQLKEVVPRMRAAQKLALKLGSCDTAWPFSFCAANTRDFWCLSHLINCF
jgi:hypothetical protein